MKQLDKLLIKSFLPPFVVNFLIALFVFIMQTLWLYIDEIMGKGAGLLLLAELIFYLSIRLVPTVLTLAVLIASVMTMGNLAEHYELNSFKSAGVPLLRVMRPLFIFCFGVAIFSFFCSDYFIPKANLKFTSRMYDIRKQKPTLSLEEGIFNSDFAGFVMRIGKKNSDNKTIENVLIYDHTGEDKTKTNQILAKSGEMYTTADRQFMIMNLKDGRQYQEVMPSSKNNKKSYPFVRTSFKEWNKVFDLGQFEMGRSDENLFKNLQSVQRTTQLLQQVDSINQKIEDQNTELSSQAKGFYRYLAISKVKNVTSDSVLKSPNVATNFPAPRGEIPPKFRDFGDSALLAKPFTTLEDLISSMPVYEQKQLFGRAASQARSGKSLAISTIESKDRLKKDLVKFQFELHTKFTWAFVCLLFLFIGAPMGAIVRKGGFGYPILISISFFMLFFMLTVMGKRLADSLAMNVILAAWLPCLVLLPVSIILTIKGMNDSPLFDFAGIFQKIKNIYKNKNKIIAK